MSKAFVIKNKNGEYIKEVGDDFYEAEPTRDISLALIYDENEMNIMKEAYPEYDYVEITIAEGNLEQQLAEKDKEIKKHIDALEYWENNIPNQRQAIRHQVCDEIREFETRYRYDGEKVIEGYFIDKEKLNQIEKGEQAKESIKND